jgi:hypothetical protein
MARRWTPRARPERASCAGNRRRSPACMSVGHVCRCEGRQLLQAHVGGVAAADDRLEPEEVGIGDERERRVVLLGGRALDHEAAVHP